MAYFRANSGNSTSNVKSGVITNVRANTAYTIETELTQVNQIHIWQGVPNTENMAFCHYDRNNSASKYVAGGRKGGTGSSNNSYNAIGSSNGNMKPAISSISGGTVVYKTGSNSDSDVGDIRWYAE